MNDLKKLLFALSSADAAGCVSDASALAERLLSKYCKPEKTAGLGCIARFKGESDYTVMIDAHIDQVAMTVTDIDEEGFLTVAKAGGIDIRSLPARSVTVHGRRKLTAVFCSTPPHLAGGEVKYDDISKIKLDTGLGPSARDAVSVGDIVTFSENPFKLSGGRVAGRSFDDRAGAAVIIALAERFSAEKLPCNVALVLSDGEELGLRGVRPAAYTVSPDEAIAVDVSFGDGIGIGPEECGELGGGAMIGAAPGLDRSLTDTLTAVAKEKNIPFQIEAMGSSTGTDADMIAVSRGGVKTCTVSIPLRNMHSEAEVLDLSDLKAVTDLLYNYVMAGGLNNA